MLLSQKSELRTQFGKFIVKGAALNNDILEVTVVAEVCANGWLKEVPPYTMYVSGPFLLKPLLEEKSNLMMELETLFQ